MKLNNRIALTIALSAALFSVSAFAEDSAAPAPAPPVVKHHHHKVEGKKVAGRSYDDCLKQKLAVAEYFCSVHADSCQPEKDGAAKQCKLEARGVRQKG